MEGRIEQKIACIENSQNIIRGFPIDRHTPVPPYPQFLNQFLIGKIVRHREGIDTGGHAILGGFIAQLDDLLNHLAFGFMKRPFLGT